jgi:hypothetical protein
MPPVRSSSNRRSDLFVRSVSFGGEMIPCTACEKKGFRCVKLSEGASRCAECIRRGLSRCDAGGPVPSDWVSLDRAKETLEREEEEAQEEHERLVASGLAKIRRIRAQRRFLRDREREMLRRGLASLDELDEVEEKEKKDREEAEQREREAQVAAPSSADASGDPFPDPFEGYSGVALGADFHPSPSFWDVSEFVGGTASKDPGS